MVNWRTERWLVLDTETTGVDVTKDRVVELGWAVFFSGQCESSHSLLVNPRMPIPAAAQAVHGITDQQVAGALKIAEAWERLYGDLASCPIVAAYNWPYDATILERQLGETWLDAMRDKVVLDPLVMVRSVGKYWPGSGRHQLKNVCERYQILPPGSLHRASADAWCAATVMWRLRYSVDQDGVEAAAQILTFRAEQDEDRKRYLASKAATP